jgi:hypothetical protein
MAGMESSGWPAGGAAAANSGIGSLGGGVYFRARFVISSRDCTYGRLRRGQDGLARDLDIKTVNLRLNLRLEFVGSTLEFVERLADLAADLRQLLGPKNDEGQEEDEDHLWETEIHEFMILPERIGGNAADCFRQTANGADQGTERSPKKWARNSEKRL